MDKNKFISILLEHKLQFIGYFILVILTTFFSIGISYLTYTIVDLAQTGTKQDIIYFGGLIIVYFISYGIVKYYRMYLQSKLLNHSIQKIKASVIQNITNLSYSNYTQETNSNYVSMIVNDCTTIEEKYYKNILELISDISILILGVGTLIYLNYYVLVWILLMLLVMLKVSKYYEEKLNSKAISVSQMNSKTISKIKDCLYSFDFTRQYGDRLKILNQFKNSNKELSKSKIELDRNMAKAESFSVATGWLMSLGIFVIAAYFVVCNQLSIATMMAIAQLMNCVSNPIISCMSYVNQIKSTKGIRNTILPLLEKNNIDQNQSSLDSLHQGITFKDVDFSYNDQIPVLNHINISFEKGKKYLMIGGSGSGKSTLLKLINKSYENYSGEIYFDQTNYKNISVEELYEHLSYVPQNIYLLNETIENNVTLFNHYSKEELNQVYQMTGLDQLISKLPEKDQTIISEDATNFSGGEKQRIAIARALLKKSNILLLDEITSALDPTLSKEIEKIILSLKDTLVISITHKVNDELLNHYDGIIHIENGKIK